MAGRLDLQTKLELKKLLGELGPDTLLLLFSNLTVIILALVQGWNITPLLWVYWCQNIIIGFFNWRRIKQLKRFSTDGLKINGRRVPAKETTKEWIAEFFLFHYGLFHLFYLFFILTITEELPVVVVLSTTIGITLFLLNHFFSYRYNLEKDLSSRPDLAAMAFFPYARVIPMHLIIFIGFQFGRGSKTELFFFLLLKTTADLLMHIIQRIDWNESKNTYSSPQGDDLHGVKKKKPNKSTKKMVELEVQKKRMTLKERLKLWLLLGWIAFLALVVIGFFVIKEFNIQDRKVEGRSLAVHDSVAEVTLETWDQSQLEAAKDKIVWCMETADGSHVGRSDSIDGNAQKDVFRDLCNGYGPDVYPTHERNSGKSWEPKDPDNGQEWVGILFS